MPTATHWDHWKTASEVYAKHGNRVPRLEPLFPIGGFSPSASCGHKQKIKRGSSFICMICHQSGWEGHPDLAVNPHETLSPTRPEYATERPEPVEDKTEIEAETQWENLTRKQKRAILFGSKEQSLVCPSDDADTPPDPAARARDAFVAALGDQGINAGLTALLGGDLPA